MAYIEQIIWTGNEYEVADYSNSEEPQWPVQDEGARWHREEFAGQRVSYHQQTVWFGFQAVELSADEVETMSEEDVMADNIYTTAHGLYRAI